MHKNETTPSANIAQNTICYGMGLLNSEKRYIFIKYLSDEDTQRVKNFSYTSVTDEESGRRMTAAKRALVNDSDYNLLEKLVNKIYADIYKCTNGYLEVSGILRSEATSEAGKWHQDFAKVKGGDYDREGTTDAQGFKAGLYIRGEATEFTNYDSDVYSNLKITIGQSFDYNGISEEFIHKESPSTGEIVIWLTGKKNGAVHNEPEISDVPRLFFLYHGDDFPTNFELPGTQNTTAEEL